TTVASLISSGPSSITLGAATLTVGDATSTTFAGVISGTGGSLVKVGAGTQTLSGANTFTGGVTIKAGALTQTNIASLGTVNIGDTSGLAAATYNAGYAGISTTAFNIVAGGSGTRTLASSNGNNTLSGAIVLNNDLTLLDSDNGNTIFSGGITGTGNVSVNTTLTLGNETFSGAALNFTGALTFNNDTVVNGTFVTAAIGSNVTALIKNGSKTLTLSGTNLYTGTTTLTGGTLSVATIGDGGVAGNLGKASNAASNLVFNGGTLQYTGATASTNRNFTLNNSTTGTVDVSTNNLTLSGATTATSGALTKIGAGILTLTGNNLHTGLTTVTTGTLAEGASNALATGDLTVNGATAIFDLGASHTDSVGTVTLDGGGSITGTGTSALTSTGTFEVKNGTAGAILAGGIALNKTTSGTATLTGANTYTGATNVSLGTLHVNNTLASTTYGLSGGSLTLGVSNVLPTTAAITLTGGTLALGAYNNTVASVSLISGSITGSGTLTSTSGYDVQSGSASAILAGGVGLNKSGGGTVTLTGANTYSGATVISGGTLALGSAGSINTTSGVNLGTGGGTFDVSAKSGGYTLGTLTGSGTVLGSLTVSTTLAIGNSPGTANFSDLTLGAASTYSYQVTGGATTADLGNVAGNLTIQSGAILNLIQLGSYTPNDKFTLFAYTSGNLSGTFTGLADDSTFTTTGLGGGIWKIDYNDKTAGLNGGVGTSFVTVTAIPESGAALLGSLGMLALLRRRRVS
ncbi:MAG: autotransporter-associated beta strand repeat-containing protein, partial [Verrucomicrobiota bacterium]